jgi:hypothetical protein
VYRIPLQVLGIGPTPFASTEALMQSWKASGLGFALNHIEEAFGQLFKLAGQPEEYVEFDTKALLRRRSRNSSRLYRRARRPACTPERGRAELELAGVDFGDEPRVQQQVVPLSYGAALQPPTPGAVAAPPAAR